MLSLDGYFDEFCHKTFCKEAKLRMTDHLTKRSELYVMKCDNDVENYSMFRILLNGTLFKVTY